MHGTIELPALTRAADLLPTTLDDEDRSIEVVWSTGARVRRQPFFGDPFDEELSMDERHVHLDRLNAGAPFLRVHDMRSLEAVIGSVVPGSARIEDGRGVARVRFSERDDVEPIWSDIRSGHLRAVSIGYQVHRYEITRPANAPELWRAVDWTPLEISAVPVGADPAAGFRSVHPLTPCVVDRDDAPATWCRTRSAPSTRSPDPGSTQTVSPPGICRRAPLRWTRSSTPISRVRKAPTSRPATASMSTASRSSADSTSAPRPSTGAVSTRTPAHRSNLHDGAGGFGPPVSSGVAQSAIPSIITKGNVLWLATSYSQETPSPSQPPTPSPAATACSSARVFGVASGDAESGAEVEAVLVGVFDLKKVGTQAWAAGDKIYWDDTARETTKTTTDNTLIGVATEAVAGGADDTIGRVRLNGSF